MDGLVNEGGRVRRDDGLARVDRITNERGQLVKTSNKAVGCRGVRKKDDVVNISEDESKGELRR